MQFKNPPPEDEIKLKTNRHKGFTLSEVLITLVIIGVVAAITVPILYANYQKEAAKTALKKNYSVMKQALDMYQAENGVRITPNDLGEHALKPLLLKYLNVMYDCGYGAASANTSCIKNYGSGREDNSKVYKTYNKKSNIDLTWFDDGQFVLTDGSLVLLENVAAGYNTPQGYQKVFISVDINGFGRKPNQLGKDLFMFQLDDKGELLPMGAKNTVYNVETFCSNTSSDLMNGAGCTVKFLNEA